MSDSPDRLGSRMRQDHERLDAVFDRFRSIDVSDLPNRSRVFEEFAAGLRRHIRIEEDLLFPAFAGNDPPRREVVAVMREEHVRIQETLDAIAARLATGAGGTSALEEALLNVLWAHNAREEGLLYPDLDEQVPEGVRRDSLARLNRGSDPPRADG